MHELVKKLPLWTLLAALIAVSACGDPPPDNQPDEAESASFLPPPAVARVDCGEAGILRAQLYGAIEGDLNWQANEMKCQGMPRPNGAGARLRFAGEFGDDTRAVLLTFIIALPDLKRATVADELPSNVTIVEEGNGRFFSTPNLDSCWTDVAEQSPLESTDDSVDLFSIAGKLYCISPLGELNGDDSVSIPELNFSGVLDWSAK